MQESKFGNLSISDAEADASGDRSLKDLKYNAELPDFMQESLRLEVENWRREILNALESAEKEPLEPNWSLVYKAVRVFYRFDSNLQYRFTREQKERIVPVIYSLISRAKDPDVQQRLAGLMTRLIKNKEELNITLDWRPTYDILKRLHFQKSRTLLYPPPANHGHLMVCMVRKIRKYFSSAATEEILTELRPLLCPYDHVCSIGMGFLSLFLPTNRTHSSDGTEAMDTSSEQEMSNATSGLPYWMDEVLAMWDMMPDNPYWDKNIFNLLKRVAYDNPNNSESWRPYYSIIFTHILRSFDLPVGSDTSSSYRRFPLNSCNLFVDFNHCKIYLMDDMAKLIVWLLPDSECMMYLRKLIKSIESYYYPSNSGSWSSHLVRFLTALSTTIARRLYKERSFTDYHVPNSFKLTDQFIEEFIELVLPLALQSMFAKNHGLIAGAAMTLKHLSYMAPKLVLPRLMERISYALTTLTETHQTISALEVLGSVILPMLNKQDEFPEGLMDYLPELLNLTLPGIDPNDSSKTFSTMRFVYNLLTVLPLWTSTDTARGGIESAPLVVQFYEDWCIGLMDKIFSILTSMTPPSDVKVAGKVQKWARDNESLPLLNVVMTLMFQQMSPSLHEFCHKRVCDFVRSNFVINATKHVGNVCNAAAFNGDKSADSLRPLVDIFYDKLIVSDRGAKPSLQSLSDQEVEYWMTLLAKTIRSNPGVGDRGILDKITTVLNLTWSRSNNDKDITRALGKSARYAIMSLTSVYPMEYRSLSPKIWNSSEFQRSHWKYTGHFTKLHDVDIRWHVPNEEEMEAARVLLNTLIESPVGQIRECIDRRTVENKQQLANALIKLRYLARGASLIMPEMDQGIDNRYSKTTLNESEIVTPVSMIPNDKLVFTRHDLAMLLHEFCEMAFSVEFEDPAILKLVIKNIYTVTCLRNRQYGKHLQIQHKVLSYNKRALFRSYNEKSTYPRSMLISRVHSQMNSRYYFRKMPFVAVHELLLENLRKLSIGVYSKVRSKAQLCFVNLLKLFHPRLARKLLPKVIEVLEKEDATDDELNGAIYVLNSRTTVKRITEDWTLLSSFLLAMAKCSKVEKPSIQSRLHQLFINYSHAYKELRLDWPRYDQSGKPLFKGEHPKPGELLHADKFNNLINEFLRILKETPNLHWRYQMMCYTCMVLLIRSDQAIMYPVDAIKQFLDQLTSDIVSIRQSAIKAMSLIWAQYKPVQKSYTMENETLKRHPVPFDSDEHLRQPQSEEEWISSKFHDKNWYGWYVLPKTTKVYDYKVSSNPQVGIFDSSIASDAERQKQIDFWKENDPLLPQRLEMIEHVKEIVMDDDWIEKVFSLLSLEPRAAHHTFNDSYAQLFKGFGQLFRLPWLQKCKPHLEKLLSNAGTGTPEERSLIALACEVIAGFARSMKHWPYADQQAAIAIMMPLMNKIMDDASHGCQYDIEDMIQFCVYDRDIRRVRWLIDMLTERIDLEHGSSATQSKSIRFLLPALSECSWRGIALHRMLAMMLVQYIDHPYKQVRDAIASGMSQIFRYAFSVQRDEHTDMPKLSLTEGFPSHDSIKEFLSTLNTRFMDFKSRYLQQQQQQQQRGVIGDLSAVPTPRTPAVDDSQREATGREMSDETTPHIDSAAQQYKAVCKTVLTWMRTMLGSSDALVPYLDQILPLLSSITETNDVDLDKESRQSFIAIARALFPPATVRHVMSTMQFMAISAQMNTAAASWRVRLALLYFIQSFGYRHQFYLIEYQDMFFNDLLLLLRDSSVEVRTLASVTLSGFLAIADEATVKSLVAQFKSAAQDVLNKLQKVAKQKRAEKKQRQRTHTPPGSVMPQPSSPRSSMTITTPRSEQLKTKSEREAELEKQTHYVVLSLSSVVRAHPYDLPDYLAEILILLTKFQSPTLRITSQNVLNTIRSTFAEFNRTHRAEWHEHSKKFSEEELLVINSLMYSPNYYA